MNKLNELAVLAIDCQATHSNPAVGHLVEIAWVKTHATRPFDHEITTENAQSYLVKTGKNTPLPRQFLRITGIEPAEMKEAVSRRAVWQKLHREAKESASGNMGICPAVIHFRRYEEPYIEQLHQEFAPKAEFLFKVVCTHEIVTRLYPGLPRKSLRAVAGFFGFSLPHYRRSLHHVLATAFIWNHVVRILEEKEKMTTFEELQDWLQDPCAPIHSRQIAREYPMEKASRQELPDKPGIYRMYRSTGDLLYVGKAKSLKHRVNSYFHKRGRHAEHTLEMLSQAQKLTTTVTETALEAAVRESDEIKSQSPPYNRALQPNERQLHFYSQSLKNKKTVPNSRYPLGPFPSNIKMESLAKLMDVLNGKIQKYTPRLIEDLLDSPPEYGPDKDCFELGMEVFKKEYKSGTRAPIRLDHMMKWGTQFWKEKLAEQEMETSMEDDEQETQEEGWTPERVFKALKRKIRMSSFQMRRARWFCRLSESCLFWSNADDSEENRHVLLFESGAPIFESSNQSLHRIHFPPGHKKSQRERQANFDIATYDRMRVVTTEIRRIIQEGRDIELCFHPGKNLKKDHLEKILKWL
jgi:DNA polymerase III epsilon subunit-like protein